MFTPYYLRRRSRPLEVALPTRQPRRRIQRHRCRVMRADWWSTLGARGRDADRGRDEPSTTFGVSSGCREVSFSLCDLILAAPRPLAASFGGGCMFYESFSKFANAGLEIGSLYSHWRFSVLAAGAPFPNVGCPFSKLLTTSVRVVP